MREDSYSVCRIDKRTCRQKQGREADYSILIFHTCLVNFFLMWILVESSAPSPPKYEVFPVITLFVPFFFFLLLSVGDALGCPQREDFSICEMKWFSSYSLWAYLVGAGEVWGLMILSGGPPAFTNNSSVGGLTFFSTKHFAISERALFRFETKPELSEFSRVKRLDSRTAKEVGQCSIS